MMMSDAEEGREVMVGVLPLFHVFAMAVVMNFSIKIGAKMILLPRFELDTVLKVIDKKRPTFFPAVPTIYIAINGHPDVAAGKYDLSSIKLCLSGGASLPREVQEKFQELSGCTLVEGYGLSETAPIATCNPISPGGSREGSLGVPVPSTVVDICAVDDPEKVLPQGEIGEICISGPQVMKGYWKRDEENKRAFAGGRFHTGDVGRIDEDGYVYLIDRLKEVIIAGGYNIYPRHVEEAIYKHPSVLEVTVIGVDDARRQQTVKAFVRLKDGQSLTTDALEEFPQGQAVAHRNAQADRISRDELPKTIIGKLSKKELVAEETAQAEHGCSRLRLTAARRRAVSHPRENEAQPMNNAVIAGYVRSPFHFAHKGALVEKRPDDLAADVVQSSYRSDRRRSRRYRGPDHRLRLPRGRAGFQSRPHRGADRRPSPSRSPAPPSTASAARRCRRSTSPQARSAWMPARRSSAPASNP